MAKKKATILYYSLSDEMRKEDKLEWFSETELKDIPFDHIMPDKNNNWIGLVEDNDWEKLTPLADKEVKNGINSKAVFKFYSLGAKTNRDEWVLDFEKQNLLDKVSFLLRTYSSEQARLKNIVDEDNVDDLVSKEIKWTRKLKRLFLNNTTIPFNENAIIESLYRPFTKQWMYFSKELNEDLNQVRKIFSDLGNEHNLTIMLAGIPMSKPLQLYVTNEMFHHDTLEKTQGLPLYLQDENGNRLDNITDWALQLFNKQYGYKLPKGYLSADAETNVDNRYEAEQEWAQPHLNKNDSQLLHEPDKKYKSKFITKEDIFHYVYAVLHNPAYREKYALNLKRDFPRIPLYADFDKWAAWGKKLMDLHINYETATPYPLEVRVAAVPPLKGAEAFPKEDFKTGRGDVNTRDWKKDVLNKPKLKADKLNGRIIIDAATELTGIPAAAWEYKLGNRSALEWILDQYKESKPKDPTIAEKFNTYRFADYEQQVIDLLLRVTTVSVETMKIVEEMRADGS